MLSGLMLFDEERHSAALESLSLQGLSDGDLAQAYKFADRRCRIPPVAKAHHYTLRGQISHRMGYIDAALDDITRALELAPNDLLANRRMLAWGRGQAQIDAASRLLTVDPDITGVASAIAVLRPGGNHTFAAIKWTDTHVTGWAVWDRAKRARITVQSDTGRTSAWLKPDPQHPLAATAANATSFTIDRPRSGTAQLVSLYSGKTLFQQTRLRPNAGNRPLPGRRHATGHQLASTPVSINVIVPVYADFAATEACFVSLMQEIALHPAACITIVDDASNDVRIKRLVHALSGEPRVRLLTNQLNLGFAGSVNRALEETGRSDVILLNADTVLPPGSIARLEVAAYGAPGIGTVTPLSNNGELTSFPVPFRFNALGSYEDVCAVDAAAAKVNAGQIVDMPNGIGFCLYVTRACLDAVGNLSEAFHRGYFEDVDLCLRAREFGFRNICAASVFVGHAGSRSFGTEKQSLVARNLETIELWYPKYRPECAAFMRADPLRPARAAIERHMTAGNMNAALLVTGPGVIRSVVDARAQDLTDQGELVTIVEVRSTAHGSVLSIINPSKQIPQSLMLAFETSAERAEALDYLRQTQPARIEIADPAMLHLGVVDLLLQLQCPVDLLIADAGLGCPRGSFVRSDGQVCDVLCTCRPCEECLDGTAPITEWGAETTSGWIETWRRISGQARQIYAPGPQAKSFASRLLGDRKVIELKPVRRGPKPSRASKKDLSGPSIGFAAVSDSVVDYRLMKDLAKALNRELPEKLIVVIGETLDDIGFMRLDNVHVTGRVEPSEHDRILRQYGIGALFVPIRQPLFGHPTIADLARRVPTASFDWSFGDVSFRSSDLALSPHLANDELIVSLVTWLSEI